MNNSNLPLKLYKYYSCNGENEQRIEARLKGEIFFSSPLNFNDPYDCQFLDIINNTENCSIDDVKRILREECFDADIVYEKLLKGDKDTIQVVYERQAKLLGILCLTNSCEKILMWSHYATNNGMCLEYDIHALSRENLFSSLESKIISRNDINLSAFYNKRILMGNVEYVPQLDVDVKLFFNDMPNDIIKKYWQKLDEWGNEEEFRIGVSLGGNISVCIPNLVKHIYLGCNCTMHQVANIWSLCQKNRLCIPISIMRKTSLGLKPFDISQYELDNILNQYGKQENLFWKEYETLK